MGRHALLAAGRVLVDPDHVECIAWSEMSNRVFGVVVVRGSRMINEYRVVFLYSLV